MTHVVTHLGERRAIPLILWCGLVGWGRTSRRAMSSFSLPSPCLEPFPFPTPFPGDAGHVSHPTLRGLDRHSVQRRPSPACALPLFSFGATSPTFRTMPLPSAAARGPRWWRSWPGLTETECKQAGFEWLPPPFIHLPSLVFLLPPSSFLLPPSSFLLPPSSFLLPPSSFLLPPSSFLLPPSSFSPVHQHDGFGSLALDHGLGLAPIRAC